MAYEKNQHEKSHETSILLVAERISNLHTDLNDLKKTMKDSMEKVADAVTQLVRMEERQSAMNDNYKMVVKQLEQADLKYTKLEERVDAIEKEQPIQKQISKWVIAAIGAIITVAGTVLLKQFGLM